MSMMVKIAINGGIAFGSRLNAKQLSVIAKYMKEEDEIELTTFQQLYFEALESELEVIKKEFNAVRLWSVSISIY